MKLTIRKAKISNDFYHMDTGGLLTFADGTIIALTGSIVFTQLTVPLSEISATITNLRAVAKLISKGDSTTTNYKLLAQHRSTLIMDLTANGHYVEDKANMVAAGDLTKAEELILTAGYKLAKRRKSPSNNFEVIERGIGLINVRAKKTKKGKSLFIWNFGLTPEKGIKPDILNTLVGDKVNVIITNLPSGSIVGIRYSENERAGNEMNNGSNVFSYASEEFYIWSDFIYVVVA